MSILGRLTRGDRSDRIASVGPLAGLDSAYRVFGLIGASKIIGPARIGRQQARDMWRLNLQLTGCYRPW